MTTTMTRLDALKTADDHVGTRYRVSTPAERTTEVLRVAEFLLRGNPEQAVTSSNPPVWTDGDGDNWTLHDDGKWHCDDEEFDVSPADSIAEIQRRFP